VLGLGRLFRFGREILLSTFLEISPLMTQFSTTYCQIIDGNRTCLSKPFRVDFSLSTKVEDFIDNVWNKIPPLPAQRTIESILAWKLKQPPLFAPRSTRKKTEHDLQAFISSLHFPEEGTPEALIGNNDVRMLYDPYPLETYWNRIPPQDTIPIVLTIKYSLEPGHTAVEEFQQRMSSLLVPVSCSLMLLI